MIHEPLVITGILLNLLLYIGIVVVSVVLLRKIKLKLNFDTKLIFYMNLIALGLRIIFSLG